MIGYLTITTLNGTWKIYRQLISGAGWLVREYVVKDHNGSYAILITRFKFHAYCLFSGKIYVNMSAQLEGLPGKFVSEKAPRTGVCAASNGSLLLVQVRQT